MPEIIRVLNCMGKMERGGAESLVMSIYREIDRKKIQFDFVVHTTEKCAFDDEIIKMGGRIYNVPRYTVKNHLHYVKAWNKLFKEHGNEWKIIHGHMFTTSAIYLWIAKKYGLVAIAHSHSTSSGVGYQAGLKNVIQYPIRFIADYFFSCSEAAGLWLFGKRKFKPPYAFVLKNAIKIADFKFNQHTRNRKRKEFNIEKNFVIGHVGRFDHAKNHLFLVDIFNLIQLKHKNSILLLIGNGSLRPELERKISKLELNKKVIFAGIRSDVPEILQAMDVFVFPSLYEGFPVTLIEAQASGLPCFVSDIVTKETKITDLLTYISLKKSSNFWADQVLSLFTKRVERKNTSSEIKKAGHDAINNTIWLQNFYLSASKENKIDIYN